MSRLDPGLDQSLCVAAHNTADPEWRKKSHAMDHRSIPRLAPTDGSFDRAAFSGNKRNEIKLSRKECTLNVCTHIWRPRRARRVIVRAKRPDFMA